MKKAYSIDFRAPTRADDLAAYIGIDKDLFQKVISSTSRREFYLEHRIPKFSLHRLGQHRVVWEIMGWPLAEAHKTVARRFELFARAMDRRFPHPAAYGYIRGRSTRENARAHCGAPLLLRADIRDFFPSITADRLEKIFIRLGMSEKAANALAKFVTVDDRLPLGLNASPMLANLVCLDLDLKIQKLADAYGCKYTRYADDISISGRRKLPSREELEKLMREEGFELSNRKFRVTKTGQAHYVTGLSISDPQMPHVPRRMKRQLRQELYYSNKFGIENHLMRINESTVQKGVNRIDGTIHYVSHIESRIAEALEKTWQGLLARDELGASYDSRPETKVRSVVCYVDECEFIVGKKSHLALCLAFTEDDAALVTSTYATLQEHALGDAFYAGDREALLKKGLHFADSHPDLRTAYIKQLSNLPYRAFIVFGELKHHDEYETTYVSLLNKILPKRFIWYDRSVLKLVFEENSKVRLPKLQAAIADAYRSLERSDSKRPFEEPEVEIGQKLQVVCFSVPDYLLAVFSRFAQFSDKREEIRRHQFERLRDKYRLILNADTGAEYSRRRPFAPGEI